MAYNTKFGINNSYKKSKVTHQVLKTDTYAPMITKHISNNKFIPQHEYIFISVRPSLFVLRAVQWTRLVDKNQIIMLKIPGHRS